MARKGVPRRPTAATVLFELSAGIGLLTVATLGGLLLIRRPWTNRLDLEGFDHLARNSASPLYADVAKLGSLPVLLAGIAIAIVLSIWRDWIRAAACLIGPFVAVELTERVGKPYVGRPAIIGAAGNSYPSGTVTAAAALVTVATLAVPLVLRPAVGLAGAGVIAAVGVAVIGMRWHFPTDVIGGACVGVGAVLTLDALFHLPGAWIRARDGDIAPTPPRSPVGAGTPWAP